MPDTLVKNSIYAINNSSQAFIVDNSGTAIPLSLEVITEITDENLTSNKLLPTIGAITTYINNSLSKINIPTKVSELTNDAGFITLSDIPEEVIYVDEFPESGINHAIYVDANKEVKIWVNNQWLDLSLGIDDVIDENSTDDYTVSAKAIYDFVVNKIAEAKLDSESVDLTGYLTKTEANNTYATTDAIKDFITSADIPEETDPIYLKDKTNIVFKSELDKYQLKTDIISAVKYVSELPTNPISGVLYVVNEQSAHTFNGSKWIPLSYEIVTDFDNEDNSNKLATVSAISGFVINKFSDVQIPTNTSELINDSGFITVKDIPEEVIYVDEFPTSDLIEHAIYVNKDKEVKIRVNGEWLDLSVQVVDKLDENSTETQLVNAKTVYDFVVNKIAEAKLEGETVDLTDYLTKIEANNTYANKTNIPTKTSDLINDSDFITAEVIKDFITLSDIPEEVIYLDEFPESGVNQAIYVNKDKQVKIWVNNQWLNLSAELSSDITENSTNTTVPDSKTVYDFVVNKIAEAKLSGGSTDLTGYLTKAEANSTYATINSVADKTEIVVGDIPATGSENKLYINEQGAVSTVINNELVSISVEALQDLSTNTLNDKAVPTCKAVADYVNNILGDIEAQLSEI